MSILIVLVIRLIFPLLILRYPFGGGVVALFLDLIDYHIIRIMGGNLQIYQRFDKLLDLYYLTLEAHIVTAWKDEVLRKIATFLFFVRVVGVATFETTNAMITLFLFPNIFEYFYLIIQGFIFNKKREPRFSTYPLVIVCILLTAFKATQEYIMHLSNIDYWKWFGR